MPRAIEAIGTTDDEFFEFSELKISGVETQISDLYLNKFNSEKSKNFSEALKKISCKKEKLIVCFGSLYNCGNILNKN